MSQNFTSSYLVVSFRAIVEFFCVQKSNGGALDFIFQFLPEMLKKGATDAVALEETTQLKQCRRSQKFTSSYWVVWFRIMLEFFCIQKSNSDALDFAF